MTLPNAHLAIVEERKVVDYLLNSGHPDNGGKARFFLQLGFSRDNAGSLIQGLKGIAVAGQLVNVTTTAHGQKYVVDGVLPAVTDPARQGAVRTVWVVDSGGSAPRLVTAYPVRE